MEFENAKVEVLKNIEAVDMCITELTEEIQKIVNAVWEYGQQQLATLQQIKAELTLEVNEAMKEVERTLHDSSPVLGHPLAVSIREYNGDLETLNIFNYRIEAAAFINCLRSVYYYNYSIPSIYERTIAGICRNKFQVYDLAADLSQEFTLSKSFTTGISTCILPKGGLLCIGGNPESAQTSIIDLKTAQISESQFMKHPRRYSGLVQVGHFAYAFGSLNTSKSDNSCEKFHISLKEWKEIPDMLHGRYAFTPSYLAGAIYLVTTRESIEVYNIASKSFNLLNVKWTGGENDCSSIFVEGQLYVFKGQGNSMGRWKPGDTAIAITEYQNGEPVGLSQCHPVRYKKTCSS